MANEKEMLEVEKELKSAGIAARRYIRSPFGKNIFAASISDKKKGGEIRFWEGLADLEVYPDKNHKQAVMFVDEKPREISRALSVGVWKPSFGATNENQLAREALRDLFRARIVLPRNSKIYVKVEDIDWRDETNSRQGIATGVVTAKTPASKTSLLMGIDETYHFIAELPRKVTSVEEAHEALKPRKLSPEAVRQGEWFFTPVSERFCKTLFNYAETHNFSWRFLDRSWTANGGFGGTHGGFVLSYRENDYAIGFITDDRGATHHKPLWLPTWHKVVRNREVVRRQPVSRTFSRRTWD